MYDIYLFSGCHRQPTSIDFEEDVHLRDSVLAGVDRMAKRPGFLHLNVPEHVAFRVLHHLKSYGAGGWVVPTNYRTPRITKDQAYHIAAAALAAEQINYSAQYTFEPVRFKYEDPMRWVFMSVSPELVQEGRAPGALHASVDKVDGHIWRDEEFEQFFGG